MSDAEYVTWNSDNAPHVGRVVRRTKNTVTVAYGSGNKKQRKTLPAGDCRPFTGLARGRA